MVPSRKFSGSLAVRAVTIAEKLAIDPPDVRTPCDPSGKANSSQSHRTTFASS
jgi:hypothetical protein